MDLIGIVVISVIIIAIVLGLRALYQNRLVENGQIIKRKGNFHEKAQIFITSRVISYQEFVNEMNKMNLEGVSCSGADAEKKDFYFESGYGWNAQMIFSGEENGSEQYTFEFLNWRERNYAAEGQNQMNMLLTALEKMFLALDPTTRIDIEERSFKTKTKFF